MADESIKSKCSLCELELPSKRKLFQHLVDVHDYVDDRAKPVKCVILVGWLSKETEDMEVFLNDPRNVSSFRESTKDAGLSQDEINGNGTTCAYVETLLFNAIRECFDVNQPLTAVESMKQAAAAKAAAAANIYIPGSEGESKDNTVPLTDEQVQLQARTAYTRGLTRGSQSSETTMAVGIERTCHSLVDTFCVSLPRPPGEYYCCCDN